MVTLPQRLLNIGKATAIVGRALIGVAGQNGEGTSSRKANGNGRDADFHRRVAEGRTAPGHRRGPSNRNWKSFLPNVTVSTCRVLRRRDAGAADDFDDLPSFLDVYYEGSACPARRAGLLRPHDGVLHQGHPQNLRYVEIFFDPQAHTSRGVSSRTVIRGIRRRKRRPPPNWASNLNSSCASRAIPTAESAASTIRRIRALQRLDHRCRTGLGPEG